MELIDIKSLHERSKELKREFNSKKPFKYVVFENFFLPYVAEEIYKSYPSIENGKWDGTTYLDQKNKFQKTKFESGSLLEKVFTELNSSEFILWLQNLTECEEQLLGDSDLFGGGLHQSTNGAYLNVHIDYNIHPKTKYHRRLNVLIYMNKDWKDEYEGHLELWDLSNDNRLLLTKCAPTFNKCVIFETNEISFHGHPAPLKTPKDMNRKSIATYYYSENRPEYEKAAYHNTVYVNTQGLTGIIKRFASGFKALVERFRI
jgi:Rps23 Pro-64 3,4-dihydroxylase Tpa1-like proline 4-hydroxylase